MHLAPIVAAATDRKRLEHPTAAGGPLLFLSCHDLIGRSKSNYLLNYLTDLSTSCVFALSTDQTLQSTNVFFTSLKSIWTSTIRIEDGTWIVAVRARHHVTGDANLFVEYNTPVADDDNNALVASCSRPVREESDGT